MSRSRVALVYCASYEQDAVNLAVARGMDLIGGIRQFVKSGEKILLKVNLLVGEEPEKCVTTHPAVFRAVAEIFKTAGAHLSFGDSPGFGTMMSAAKKSGITGPAEELGIIPGDFREGREIFNAGALQNKKFYVANAVLDADGVVSLPKLKTHALERFTGAVKNQFGCVVGMRKGEFHVKLPDAKDFGRMLVDLNNFVKPRLYIMDGIMAMEGNGPRGGIPRSMKLLLFSTDPVALDATACRLINLDPSLVPTNVAGFQSGCGTWHQDEIELIGDPFDTFFTPDFKADRSPVKGPRNLRASRFLNNRLVPRPVILDEKCTLCGTCVQSCPVEGKAVNWSQGNHTNPPVYDYDQCIRCYCCQEMCPEGAIVLKDPLIRKMARIIS